MGASLRWPLCHSSESKRAWEHISHWTCRPFPLWPWRVQEETPHVWVSHPYPTPPSTSLDPLSFVVEEPVKERIEMMSTASLPRSFPRDEAFLEWWWEERWCSFSGGNPIVLSKYVRGTRTTILKNSSKWGSPNFSSTVCLVSYILFLLKETNHKKQTKKHTEPQNRFEFFLNSVRDVGFFNCFFLFIKKKKRER